MPSTDNKATVTLCNDGSITAPIDEVEAVELSEKVLIEWCGFDHTGIRYRKSWFYLWDYNNRIVFCIIEMFNVKNDYLNVSTLHHLQNLYKSLTGEQLEVKIKHD